MTLVELRTQFTQKLIDTYTKEEAESLFFIFLRHHAGFSRIDFLSAKGQSLPARYATPILNALDSMVEGIPYQHLLGEVEFADLRIKVSADALIPRPETEELVYLIRDHFLDRQPSRVLDIGTGTGCIALACARFFPEAKIRAIDISASALELAKQNAELNGLRIELQQTDFLRDQRKIVNEAWDLIISNPPYIAEWEASTMHPVVTQREPHQALFVPDDDPLVFYRGISEFSTANLKSGGWIFLEINERLGMECMNVFEKRGFEADLRKDLSGKDRFIVVKRA